MSNPDLLNLCLICGQKSPRLAFCSEKCRSLAISRAGSASEPSTPTTGLSRTLSEFCQLLSLPEAVDFNSWLSKTRHKQPETDKMNSLGGDLPDQVSSVSEKASHELEEYERCFDQTRRQKMQVGILFHSGLHWLVVIIDPLIAQANFNLSR